MLTGCWLRSDRMLTPVGPNVGYRVRLVHSIKEIVSSTIGR
jgi:hypothetical protein